MTQASGTFGLFYADVCQIKLYFRFICRKCFYAAERKLLGFTTEQERKEFLKKCTEHSEEHRVDTIFACFRAYHLFFSINCDSWHAVIWKATLGFLNNIQRNLR